MRPTEKDRSNERGAVLAMMAAAIILLCLTVGISVDIGTAYVRTMSLSKAVDAAALAGARYTTRGEAEMRKIMEGVAASNFGSAEDDDYGANYKITITHPSTDTTRVRVDGVSVAPALFARIIGRGDAPIRVSAEATRYPLDMSLVLDLSGSLERNDAFDDMQVAARGFFDHFDDNVDQFGIVTYSTWAEEKMPVKKNFTSTGKSIIDGLSAISDTNIQEGLRLGKVQLDAAMPRQEALKFVVLFTDGQSTAAADTYTMPSGTTPKTYNGVVATYVSGSSYRGLFQISDGLKIIKFSSSGVPTLTTNSSSTASPKPTTLPNGKSVSGDNIRSFAATKDLEEARKIRRAGYTIFCIGLGNPNATTAGDAPDLDHLRKITNENGIIDGNETQGELLFAPSPTELEATFTLLAERIITRLTR
jgi:Flp pilus assembly protein TadG